MYSYSSMALESTLWSKPLLSKPDSLEEKRGFLRVESLDCWNSSSYSSMKLSFFWGCWAWGMNLFMKEGMVLPMEMPRILLAPCSEGSTTFFYFYSEKARLDQNKSFFSFSLSTLIAPQNFFITSPSKSVAFSGGFSFQTTGFLLLESFFLSFLGYSYLTGYSALGGYSLLESILMEEDSLDSVLGAALAELLKLLLLLLILELELEGVFEGFSSQEGGGTLGALLGYGFFSCLDSPMKLLVLSAVALVDQKQLFTFASLLTAPTSPDTICCTRLSRTACESGFLISILKDCARRERFMPTLRLISFLKTLRVCLNLKLSRNSWMRSMQSAAEDRGGDTEGILLEFGQQWVFILEARFIPAIIVLFFDEVVDIGLELRLHVLEVARVERLVVDLLLQLRDGLHLLIIMSLKNSLAAGDSQAQRIRVGKRRETSQVGNEESGKRSMNIAQAFEHEKAMAQSYREKNERNIMKCKFLYNKLTTLGNLQGVPEMIASEVSEIDLKIKQLQQLLNFKRSHQMKNLRKKVVNFLQQINFEIQAEDMEKIEDEIEIILFLIDIFEEKFNEMTAERKEINEIISRLEKENETDFNADYNEAKKENERLLAKLIAMENQMERIKSEDYGRRVESEHQKDFSKLQSIPEEVANKNLQIERQGKRIEDLQSELGDTRAKLKIVQSDLQRARRQQVRLKQRFRVMQSQKNERIKLLEQSFK